MIPRQPIIDWQQNLAHFLKTRDVLILHGNVKDSFILLQQGNIGIGSLSDLIVSLRTPDPVHFFDPVDRLCMGTLTADHASYAECGALTVHGLAVRRRDASDFNSEADLLALQRRLAQPIPPPSIGPTQTVGETEPEITCLVVTEPEVWVMENMNPEQQRHQDDLARRYLLLRRLVDKLAPGRKLVLIYPDLKQIPRELYMCSPRTAVLQVPLPGPVERRFAARRELRLSDSASLSRSERDVVAQREALLDMAANLTAEMPLSQIVNLFAANPFQTGERSASLPEQLRRTIHHFKFGERQDPYEQVPIWRLNQVREFFTGGKIRDEHGSEIATMPGIEGQESAIEYIEKAIWRAVTNVAQLLRDAGSLPPRGVLFFPGPTGTGKTMAAKRLARFFFDDEEAFVRFDMSDYMQDFSVTRLVGAPPGYVGSAEGGELTNSMLRNPCRVILFDEIEKAHPRIHDMFLQILSDGRLTDSHGQTVFFSEAIIVFTSNVGMRTQCHGWIGGASGGQTVPCSERDRFEALVAAKSDPAQIARHFRDSVEQFFELELSRPELLGRLYNIIPFQPVKGLTATRRMFESYLDKISRRFSEVYADLGLKLTMEPGLLDFLTTRHEPSVERFGGRAVVNALEDELLTELARSLVLRKDSRNLHFRARVHGNRIVVDT